MTRILSSTLIALCLILSVSSCETYEYVDYQAMEDAEKKLLDDFYKSHIYDSLYNKVTKDTIDERAKDNTGWLLFRKEKGEGDPIKAGKYVGIRYAQYVIGYDSKGVVTFTDTAYNYIDLNPEYFQVGNYNKKGMNNAIQYLNNYGKGYLIMSSTAWEVPSYYSPSSYTPIVYDFEITYYQK